MRIQEIEVSNNQKKRILKEIKNGSLFFEDDNGDVVVQAEGYLAYKEENNSDPLATIIGEDILDYDSEFFVFV